MPDYKKPGAPSGNSKGSKSKPFVNKPKKKELSPALMIGIFIFVILLACGFLFLLFKKPLSNKPQTKTVYVKAEKEKEKNSLRM